MKAWDAGAQKLRQEKAEKLKLAEKEVEKLKQEVAEMAEMGKTQSYTIGSPDAALERGEAAPERGALFTSGSPSGRGNADAADCNHEILGKITDAVVDIGKSIELLNKLLNLIDERDRKSTRLNSSH